MSLSSSAQICLALLQILSEESDESHPLPMPKILSLLGEKGLETTRQYVYHCFDILRGNGYEIVYVNAYRIKGYYLSHLFSSSEALFLTSIIADNKALSDGDRIQLETRLYSLLSAYQKENLPEIRKNVSGDDSLLAKIDVLMQAVKQMHPVEFNYFDITLQKKKEYRRNQKRYRLIPYALVPYQNRYYCIFYDPVHLDFTNYRIDKMDHIATDYSVSADPVPFNLDNYMQASFNMYHGQAETVVIRFQKDMASLLIDEFEPKNIIIYNIEDKYFTAAVRTAVTPTLTAWLLMYYDRCEVIKPDSLKRKLKKIGISLISKYGKEEYNNE